VISQPEKSESTSRDNSNPSTISAWWWNGRREHAPHHASSRWRRVGVTGARPSFSKRIHAWHAKDMVINGRLRVDSVSDDDLTVSQSCK
jgi:hypothetical protein